MDLTEKDRIPGQQDAVGDRIAQNLTLTVVPIPGVLSSSILALWY